MLKGKMKWVVLAVVTVFVLALVTFYVLQRTSVEEPGEPAVEIPNETELKPEELLDFGGRTIKVAAWWDVAPEAGTPRGEEALARLAELQEEFNFTLEWVNIPWDVYPETLTASVLAGDPIGDKVIISPMQLYSLAIRGFLRPLEEFYDLNDPLWNTSVAEFATFDGRTYGVYPGDRVTPQEVLFFNKTLFEREGLPNLYEFVENREWTWNKMIEIAEQATRDLDGDGAIDQWGISALDMFLHMIHSNMGSIVEMFDGRPTLKFGEPAAVEALQAYFDILHGHKVFDIPPEGSPWDWPGQRFQDGKTAMFVGSFGFARRFVQNMADDFGVTVFPMGPRATEYVSYSRGAIVHSIPVGVKKPEQVAIFWERRSAPFPEDLEDPDHWVPDYAKLVRDEESLDTIRYIWENNITRYCLMESFRSVAAAWGGLNWELIYGGLTPAVLVEERLTPLQTELDHEITALKDEKR